MILETRLCDNCSSRPARVMCLRRRHQDVCRTYVCLECASERARLYANPTLDFERILTVTDADSGSAKPPAYGCRFCGTTIADIVADGRPGCCVCYSRFAGEVAQAIDAAQGRSFHVGKTPAR